MSSSQRNTDVLIKQKFDNYAVVPPANVWDGIQAGIVVKPSFFALYWKSIAAAVLILAIVTAGVWYYTSGDFENSYQPEFTDTDSLPIENGDILESKNGEIKNNNAEIVYQGSSEQDLDIEINKIHNTETANQKPESRSGISSGESIANSSSNQVNKTNTKNETAKQNAVQAIKEDDVVNINYKSTNKKSEQEINTLDLVHLGEINTLSKSDIDNNYLSLYSGENAHSIKATSINSLLASEINDFTFKKSKWSIGFYFSPEMMLTNFDSIEVLTNYSAGIEPTYLINDHLFLRFGLGASYSRDRGFAKLDYLSNDLLGTYDYVYDVTFDSIDGQAVPTYHTTTAEVWDTIRHLEINSITNNYVYLQAPVLFGYYNLKNKFKWYVYGGPAFNLMVSKQIEEPLEGFESVDIINLQNELPERSPYYFQLWLGAGIEYKAGKNLGISFEPNYRYYFKNVFNKPPYSNSGLSGLSLRFGLVYTIQ